LELDTVIGSDLPVRNAFSIANAGGFSQDEYIKQYLLDSELPVITRIKILLYYHISNQPDLILQLNVFRDYLEKINPFLFFEVFGTHYKNKNRKNLTS